MAKNAELRMYNYIISLLGLEGFDLFVAPVRGESSDVVIRFSDQHNQPQYIELQILSRTEEFLHPIKIPFDHQSAHCHYFFILYSAGMNKIWLHTATELLELRAMGENRDSSLYLVTNFDRLRHPSLELSEYKQLTTTNRH